ncbi:MAG: hypothetical protein HC767_09825 [Akkermansiaceae bacterium]|nr:hypothetical protein [Akkermansiaceae bacterium]
MKAADVMSETIIQANSVQAHPVQCVNVLRLVKSSLTDPKPHQFRIKFHIKVMQAGVIESKEIISNWLPFEKLMASEH